MSKNSDNPSAQNFETVRKRAKQFVKALRDRDEQALARLRAVHPRFRADEPPTDPKLHHAQLVIARESGFTSWPRLKAWFNWKEGRDVRLRPFRTDLDYFRDRATGIRSMLEADDALARDQVRLHHPRFREAEDDNAAWDAFDDDDAALVLASQHGFESWDAFAAHIEALDGAASDDPFRRAYLAIENNEPADLEAVIAEHPEIIDWPGTNGNTLLGLASATIVTPDLTKSPRERNTGLDTRYAMVRALIDAGASLDAANQKGWTPLHQAAYSNDPVLAGLLVEAGATIDLEAYGDGGTPLTVALWWGHQEVSDYLASLAVVPRNLRIMAALGDIGALETFFSGDGSLTSEAGQKRTFHRPHSGFPPWKPTPGKSQEIIDDAFSFAARNGQIAAMAYLHERGAGLDSVPCNGTPLMWAVISKRYEAVDWLIAAGADVMVKADFARNGGQTALHSAAFADDAGLICTLVNAGADPAMKDDTYDSTPLGWASFLGREEAAETLVEACGHRCNVDDLCMANAWLDVVRKRLDDAPEQVHGPQGTGTPLRAAAYQGQNDLVALLLERGADPNATNAEGRTARDLAAEQGHDHVVAVLDKAMGG